LVFFFTKQVRVAGAVSSDFVMGSVWLGCVTEISRRQEDFGMSGMEETYGI
jgi:hypothetical protein